MNVIDKILSCVEPFNDKGCLLYLGHITEQGYGRIKIKDKSYRVHRLIFEHFHGPLAVGLMPDHLCRVRHCIHPDHMEAVTNRVNLMRGVSPSAICARKTHCSKGHPYGEESSVTPNRSKARRICRICDRAQNKIQYDKRKLARLEGE